MPQTDKSLLYIFLLVKEHWNTRYRNNDSGISQGFPVVISVVELQW